MRSNLFILSLVVLFISCHSTKKLPKQRELENISEGRLFKNIVENELNFQSLYSKKMDISLSTKKKSNSLKATMQMKKDSFICISMSASPLGINVARLLLTPDSIKFVNFHDKEYFISDYSYFSNRFDLNLSFDCFQRILSNYFFNFESCTSLNDRTKRYKFDKSGNNYLLYTLEEKALGRKLKKLYKKRRKNKEYSLILQEIQIDPDYFRPCFVSIKDIEEQIGLNVKYDDFKDFGGYLYPGKILFNLYMESDPVEVKIVFDRLEFDVKVESNFKISSKYKRIY